MAIVAYHSSRFMGIKTVFLTREQMLTMLVRPPRRLVSCSFDGKYFIDFMRSVSANSRSSCTMSLPMVLDMVCPCYRHLKLPLLTVCISRRPIDLEWNDM
jgi:hypothetical protein